MKIQVDTQAVDYFKRSHRTIFNQARIIHMTFTRVACVENYLEQSSKSFNKALLVYEK